MLPLPEIFHNFILPALIAVVGFVIAWTPIRGARDGRWIGGITIGLSFAVAYCAIAGRPPWPPGTGDALNWLYWFAIPVAALGMVDGLLRPANWLRAGVVYIVAGLGVRLILSYLAAPKTSSEQWSNGMWADAFAGIVVACWLAMETLAERTHRATTPIILAIIAGGVGVVLGVSDDVKPSMAAVSLAGVCAVAAVLAWPFRSLSLGRGAVLAVVVPLAAMIAIVHFFYYTEPPLSALVCLAIAPFVAFAGDLPWVRRLGLWREVVRIVLVVAAIGAAAGLSVRQAAQSKHAGGQSAAESGEY